MSEFLRNHWVYLIGAVLLHVLFAGIFGLTLLKLARQPQPATLAIQAVVVDRSMIDRATRQQQRERAQEREQERQRQQDEQRKQQERREAEQRAEQERQQEQKQREEQQQRQQAEEQQQREKQEAERKAQAEAERQRKAEAERQRVAEIERKQKEEAQRRKAAEDARMQAQREAELQSQLESEEGEMQLRQSDAYAAYRALIARHIERYWNKPPSARAGVLCEVTITQAPSGSVLAVRAGECNGDSALRQSIEVAVQKASPLPTPEDPRLFDRTVIVQFKPE